MDPIAELGLCFGIAILLILLLQRFIREILRLWEQQNVNEVAPRILLPTSTCPVCDGRLESHLMTRHLIVTHDMEVEKAAELVEVMRSENAQSEE